MLKKLFQLMRTKTDAEIVEEYLAQSTSLADLERRQKDLRRRGYIA